MRTLSGSCLILALLALLTGCNGEERNAIRFDYAGTMMDTCAETDIGFHPDAADLTGAAESILFETIDKVAAECEGASIDIVAYAAERGDEIAYMRTATVENTIVSNYDISDSRISKDVAPPPSEDLVGYVSVSLMVEVPVEEE